MSDVAKKHADQLDRIKKNVQTSHTYWMENILRYDEFKKLVFVTSIDDKTGALLRALDRPIIEFNILEAYISRLRGEFSKQEPDIEVSNEEGQQDNEEQANMIQIIEDHIRYVMAEARKQGLEYQCYTDTLAGGWSVIKCYTDFKTSMSFAHEIIAKRAFDPCLCGFDPMAMLEDKSDGLYAYENYPMRKTEFEEMYPDKNLSTINFSRSFSGFKWSYATAQDEILMLCDYYEKKTRWKTIVLLSNNTVMEKDKYQDFVDKWNSDGKIEQVPQIVGERKTQKTTICRYKLIENQVLEYTETDYPRFPLIFVDGNSVLTKGQDSTTIKQMTRPYCYNAKGSQQMKNYAGQSLCNELENLIQGQWIVAEGSVKAAYSDAYKNPQRAATFIYSPYKNDDPNVPLPPPQVVQRAEIPKAISEAFMMSDQITQSVLGSFDASMAKLTTQEMSGIAMQETITLSNTAAMPYVVSFMHALQSLGQFILELIPLYYTTPMTIPVQTKEGKRSYVKINQEGGISLDYDKDAIKVRIEAGSSFGVQQSRALNQIISLMSASELFAAFVNEVGLGVILDNVEIRGITQLRAMAEEWMAKQQELAAQNAAQQQAMAEAEMNKPNLEAMALELKSKQIEMDERFEQMRLEMDNRKIRLDTLISLGNLKLDQQKAKTDLLEVLVNKEESDEKNSIQRTKDELEAVSKATDFALKGVALDNARKDKSADRALKFHTARFPKKRDVMAKQKQETATNER